jgi:aspartyl-tRNA(Asn)/glutamyl-tRNA(Gln) amidotransferase subunit A
MTKEEILKMDLVGIAEALASLSITSEELTGICLNQIEKVDRDIGAMLWIDKDQALAEAKASDDRRRNNKTYGPLDGIPIAFKDMILVKGLPCTAASKILSGYMPPYEAFVTSRLREQGVVVIGKANQDEFAMGSSTESSAYKITRNPWNLAHTPGGSSGGSVAAVSAGMCFGSLGTDTGGSIRQPASFCGLVGLKPSYGRVSRFGVIAFASSLDQVGPFGKTVRDCAILLKSIAGHDSNDSTSHESAVPDYLTRLSDDVKGKRIGVPREYFAEGLDDEVKKAVENCLEKLQGHGAELVEISLPHTKYAVATYYIIATAEASSNLSRYDGVRYGPRRSDNHDLLSLYETTRGELFGTEVKRRIILGTHVLSAGYYDAYYLRAQKVRRLFSEDFAKAFQTVDAIVSPTAPTTAFKINEKVDNPLAMYLNDIYTISANLAGICAISIPIALDKAGLPIGLQLMAKAFNEQALFDVGASIEADAKFDPNPPMLR